MSSWRNRSVIPDPHAEANWASLEVRPEEDWDPIPAPITLSRKTVEKREERKRLFREQGRKPKET